MCLPFKTYEPEAGAVTLYDELFALYRKVYFAFGSRGSEPTALGEVLPELRRIAAGVWRG
jgi:L-ribulokinase